MIGFLEYINIYLNLLACGILGSSDSYNLIWCWKENGHNSNNVRFQMLANWLGKMDMGWHLNPSQFEDLVWCLLSLLQRCQSEWSKNPEIVANFLKMHFCLYFCTEASEKNFLKSGNFLKTGISAFKRYSLSYVVLDALLANDVWTVTSHDTSCIFCCWKYEILALYDDQNSANSLGTFLEM